MSPPHTVAPADLPRILSQLPLFSDMQPEELLELAQGCRVLRLDRGDGVFRYGDPCNSFHVVLSGQVKLFAVSPSGQEKIIELLGPGATFGEALMFTDRPYIVNAHALSPTHILNVSKAAVLAEIARDSRFALRMLAGMSRRLHRLVNDVQGYALHSGVQRVIGYLLHEMEAREGTPGSPDGKVALSYSKSMIASRLSITPEYFSRILRDLEDHGLIQVDGRNITIQDTERLAQYLAM